MTATAILAVALVLSAPPPSLSVESNGWVAPTGARSTWLHAQSAPASKPAAPEAKAPPAKPTPTKEPGTVVSQPGVNQDALVLVDFKQRIDKYVQVHNQAKKSAPPAKETKDPAMILAAEEGLANGIRALRAGAKAGDIFTPQIRDRFRRLMYPEVKGKDGHDTKQILKDDAPPPSKVEFKANAKYPEGAALPTVPPNILLNLPTLPEELEYRIIGKHLILRDTTANIIVDYIPNAIR